MGKTDFFSKNNDFKKNYIFISYILLVSNLTNKYNPQEHTSQQSREILSSNLTNKYNPQELPVGVVRNMASSNLTNKYNPQERLLIPAPMSAVQILPINTILKNFCVR